nr:MAG TPA: cytosine DNA methyltransferase [Caudoviricetes sp.]
MADKDNKSKLTYHVWDKDNNEYDIPDEVVQQRGMDNFAKDFEGGYITMFDDKKQKVDVPIEDVGEYRKQGYIWYDTSGNATPINEVGKKPSPSSSSQGTEQSQYPQEVLDAFNSPDNKPGNFKDLAQLNDEYQRGELKKPSLISQALGMMPKVDAGNIGREQKMGGMITSMLLGDNMQQPQDNNQQVQHSNQENAPATEQPKPTVKDVDAITGAAPVQQVDAIYNKYVGKGDALSETMYDLMASGQAQNQEEAQSMAMGAMNRAANRLAQRTTDEFVSKLGDTVEGVDEAVMNGWHSHAVQDNLKKMASQYGIMNSVALDETGQYITQTHGYDQFINGMVKPAMVESLVKKYGENYRKTAEDLATRLYSNDEVIQNQLMNQDIDEALSSVISKYVNPSVVEEYNKAQEEGSKAFNEGMEGSQNIPASLRLGTAIVSQYEANQAKDPQKTLSALQKKFNGLYKNPQFLNDMSNAAFKVMQRYGMNGTLSGNPKQFKPMIDEVLKAQLNQLEVKNMIPKGSAEYIMNTGLGNTIVGKITRKLVQTDYQNWLEDIANQQYQPGFWERVGSGALTFAGDAWSYWLPGAAGGKVTKSMLAKAEGRLASDLMAKGMEAKMAERAAKVLIGKSKGMALKTGAAHGAVTFGGQSAISKPIDEIYRTGQLDEYGKVYNPSVGKILANTLGEVAKQSAVGAIMQGGTIANMVGKGRGLATNVLADVGGKVVDSSIMTGQQMLERMAHDPNFKPTGKDFAESALESMANLVSIGFPGMVGKYARFKDAKEFNRKFDFNDRDIAELKRFGYDDLRDAFEKLGINGYRAEGEGVQMMGQLTDKYMNLMNDKSVPEVLKAKMMAVVEGKRPSSFSPVIDSIIVQPMDNDGKVYLETLNKDGGIIDRKEYSSLEEAQKAEKKLDFEKSLNITSEYEKAYHTDALQDRLNTVYEQARDRYAAGEQLNDEDKAAIYLHQNASAIGDIMQKQQKGMELTEQEQQMLNSYRHFYDSAFENSPIMKEYVRTFEDSQGVEHGTLRKALEGDGKSRTAEQQKLVEEYQKQLYNDIVLKREMNEAKEQMNQNLIEGQRELPGATQEGGASAQNAEATAEKPVDASVSSDVPPTEPPTPPVGGETPTNAEGAPLMENGASPSDAKTASNESKSNAYVMGQKAYQNGDVEGLKAIDHNDDVSKARLKRAFGDDEAQMNVVVKAYEEGKDMEQFVAQSANSMTPAQQDAVRKYVEAQDAKKGVYDALQHADDGYGDALKELLWTYQTEDGNIVPATLTTGQQVFLKKANEYGGGFVVVPDEDGNPAIKQVSSADIKEVGTPVPMDDYINQQVTEQKNARQQQFFAQYDGSGLKPSDIVEVAMEADDEPMQMTFAGYSEDGKIVLSDGKDNIALTKDEFNTWRQNALDASIGAELDAEDAQRANDDAAKAEADKKQRYNEGIVGLGMGQPDYSSKDTEPKVAAEYLQEQFGNDHGKLMNLISGSRSDIKEQLDNKRKAASEYEDWLSLNADLDPEKAQKVENDLALVNEQIADLETRYKNWNAIRKEVMTPEEARTLKNERKAEIEKAGVDENAITSADEREVAVLDNKELKKQYPTMDEASNYIASERKRIYHIQNDEVQPQIDDINEALEQYMNGDIDYSADQLKELNTTKAQLEARQANLSASAKDLKAQDKLLNTLYSAENKEERAKAMEELTPSEQRKVLVADAFKKNDLGVIKEIYKDASIDVMDLTPQTLEEAVSEALSPHSLNAESLQAELGKDNFKYGIGKGYDSNKFNYLLAKKGTGLSVNEFAVRVYNDLPVNLQDMGYSDQDVRNTLLDMFKSYDNVKDMRNVALMNRIAAAEEELSSEEEYYEAQKEREIIERQAENPDYYAYLEDNSVPLPSENELNHIAGMEYDRMMEIENREREYKQYVKSILPELADYDDRSNEEGYGGGSSLGSDSSRRGVDEGNRNRQEDGSREASAETETGALHNSTGEGRQEISSLASGEGSADRTPHLPQEASFGERLKNAIAETEPNPSEAQKKAGNYKKGHLSFGGYDFTVETPKGATRSGKDEQGKPWSVTMHDTYGYILGKIGVDGDHIDMFINDAADLDSFDGNVYVVDQVNQETGEFDEHKVMYGYPSEEAATEAYLANYSKDWKGLGKVTAVPKATFDKWLESSDRKTKPFADYAMVQKEQRAAYKEEMMQDGAHSEAFDKIVELAKEQKQYWDLMEQGEVEPDDVPEVDVAFDMDELLKTLSDEEFKEVSDVLKGIDEEFEYYTANEYERREGAVERKKKAENAKTYEESIKEALKPVTPVAIALKSAVESGDKKAIKQAQKELTEALISSDLGLDYLSGQLAQAKLVKKKDELYKVKRATVKPFTDAIHAIETAENIDNSDFIAQMEYDYENDIHPSEEDMPKMQKFVERLLNFHSDKEDKTDSGYTILSSNIQGDKLYPNEKKWFGTGKYRKGVSWVDKQNNCAYEVNPRFNNRGYLSAVGVHKIVPLIKFDRDVKEVKPSEMTEAQKVAFDAVSTMLKKAGIPVKVISNEEMEKVAEEQDNLAISMLMSDPQLRFNIKTPEQKKAAKAAYDWATEHRPDKYAQYAIVNMDKPNQMPEYFEKKSLAEQWRKYYTNAWGIGNYKAFDLNKPFEEQVKDVKGDVPSEFDPYKVDAQNNKRNELKKQIKETEDAYNSTGQERNNYQIQLMKEYMDEHGLASENDIPDDVWSKLNDKAHEKYQDKLDSLFAKYKDLDRQLKDVVLPGVRFLRTYHGSGADTKFAQGKGVAYGYTDGKEIVLNQEHLNPNTPIHEYQHIWRTAAKVKNPELIEHGDNLIKQTEWFKNLQNDPNYKHLSEEKLCDEAFARLTGDEGEAILEQMAKDAIKENPLDTAKELSVINKLKEWLKKFWYWTLETFTKWKPEDIKKMTLEDIRNLVLRDLAQGVDPRTVLKGQMTKDEAVSLRQQMADNAEPERILEHTEDNWLQDFGKDGRVNTPIGSIKLGENQYKKAGREDRIKRFGLLKPTLERPDVILEKPAPKEGAERQTKYLFVKSFKKVDGTKILNFESITVKQGEDEVSISAHQIEPSKLLKELTESKMLWNRFRGDSNSLGENQGSALTPSANNPSGKDSVLNPHSDAKIRNSFEITKENGGNLSVEDKIKAVSQQFGVDEADVAMYANAIKKGSTAEAARARANIKRHLMQVNEDKISSFKELLKYTVPVNNALKENFGDLDAMIEERKKQVEAQRNAMEAARKRAEEEEAKRQKHLEELSLIPDDKLDKQYMDALAKGDDATAREMLDEAARRKGYDDTESAYQGVGAWAAPGNPGYESDKARRDDWESSGSDVNLEDMALGYTPQPDDYFSHPERYSQNTPHGLESVKAINTAIDAIKNGEKDVKVKVYRAVPTSVKEGKLRNGDWVTPSKKYAEMHGTNRLEGKYRIIEDEVPSTQLWWDGNDANEFGFDDGKEYKYKNAKNNRKLNDLVTYDDEGDVIPPSKRFNSRKSDIRFMFGGEKGAAEADKAEEKTYRMDNLKVAEKMERGKKDAKAIKLATGWERGADGKWRYEMPDAKIKDMKDIGGGNIVKRFDDDMLWNDGKLTNVIDAPGLFEAYPKLKDVRIDTDAIMNDMPSNGEYNPKTNTITIHADELKYMNSILNHEIQHAIQYIEGFGKGGSPEQMEKEFKEAQDEWKARAYAHELEEKAKEMGGEYNQSEVEKALVEEYKDLDMSDELPDKETRIKGFNYFARGYADRSMDDTIKRFRLNESTRSDFDSYKEYLKLAGEVESRNVEKRLGMNDEERRNSLAEETEDVPRDSQIVSGNARASYKIVEQKLQKHPDSLMKAGTYFSGGGLVEEGLKGIIDPVVAVEYDRKISGVYRNNFGQHIVTADVRDVDPKELVKHIDGEVEYFHASPVCKNYSQAKSNGGEVELDKETAKSTADFIDAVKPRVVTIENVKGYKDSEAMKIITQALDKNGYKWDADVYNAADFGGYTSRERLIVRAVKDGELPEKPKKQPRKGGWLEAVKDILPTLTEKKNGVAPWMDTRLKVDGIDWQKVEKPLYVMGSAYADGKIPHAYGDEILPTLRTKSGDVIIMPGGKVLRADGRVLARITGLGDDYLLPKTESLAHTIIGNGIPVQLTKGVIAPLLNKDDLSGRNVLARLGSSIFKNNWDADKQKQVSDRVVNTANKLGGAEATVYTSVDEVPDAYLSDVKNGATGWYDPTTHTVHVYLPNCADADEAQRTVFHEKIGHEGMEVLLGGEQGVRKFADFVYKSVDKKTRGKILDFAHQYDPGWNNPDRINIGTQEYIAHLAEEGPTTAEDFSLWTKIKHYLIKVLKKLGIRVPGLLNDKDLRYYLMKAGKALHIWDNMPKTQQEAMMAQASNAEIKDALADGAGKGKPRQKKGESAIQYMKRVMEWKRWKEAREDKEDPEPPMFYDFDKDAEGKKEWERLNKEWRDSHGLRGEEMPLRPERKEGESDDAFMNRYKEWEKWNDAMGDKENPMPDMFSFEKQKQDEARQKYEDWLTRHELSEQNDADLDLYEGKIYPAETNPEADALEQEVMQDLAEVTSTDVSKEGAATTVKHAVIHRRKNMEEASADDAIYINDVKNSIEKMAESGAFDKLLSDYQGKPNKAEKLAEAIPYIIEAPRRIREIAYKLNSTGVFGEGHIHITPDDVEAIQELRPQLAEVTANTHTEIKDGKEVKLFDDMKGATEVASKMADIINGNHEKEPGFVPIDGTDILNKNVLPIILNRITPYGVDYKNLSEPMKSVLDSIRDWYNYTFDWLKDNNTLKADTGFTVDYVNHLWDKEKSDKNAYAMYVENRQRTKSPNEKPRQINTIMEGLEVGLVPKTTDITKMMAYYSRSNIEAWANKTMLQEVSGLNVIERNEDGEIISSDPLLSSVAPFNLEQYKYFEIPGIGPVWVYKGNAKDYTIPNIITGKKILLYRQKSAAKRFGVVFEQYESSPFWETVDTLASSAKKLELGFSGFHAGALTEVYMVQNMTEFGPKKALANFMKYIFVDTMKNHQLPCFANPQDFQEAATHLVKFGATNDYAAADVQNMFDNWRDFAQKLQQKLEERGKIGMAVGTATIPFEVATQMVSMLNKGMDVALWDFLHDGLKLATYRMRADRTKERAKKYGWTDEQLGKALDEDGQFVNDMFGGQHWDVLGASHRTLRYAGRVLLSPDWNASTTRHFLALTGFGSVWNEATFENFKNYYKNVWAATRGKGKLTPDDWGRLSRQLSALLCYGIGFMIFYEGFANAFNAAFRALDEEKERKKAEELRKTNPNYRSPYELAYPDGMKWYDYLMRGNSLGQQSKIFMGRYADGTEMYIRHGKQFREVPEYLFNHKGELEFPGPMVQRMIGKANPMVRMTLDDINYLSDFQASHADQEIQRKYGKTIGLLYKDALYWAPFLIPSQENKEFKAVDFFFPSSKGFSPWKAQSYFKDFILSGDMEGVVMTYQSCERNGIDPEEQIKAAIGSVKALESAEMKDGITSLQVASERFDEAKSITEKKKMRQKMKKFLSMSAYKAFTQKEALDMVQSYLNGEDDLKEMEKAENKYLMKAKSEDVTEDWRIQAVWNGTMETYDEYLRLKDVDKAKANAFKNSKTNKRLFAARKAISAAKKKMNKAKKQMDGQNDAAKMVEIRKTRKELLKTLNGME